MTYTIDLVERPNATWRWRAYGDHGTVRFADGGADSIEAAVDAAKTALLVEHRNRLATE